MTVGRVANRWRNVPLPTPGSRQNSARRGVLLAIVYNSNHGPDGRALMRVFVAGANGAIGMPLTRQLLARGHHVIGLIRNPAGVAGLHELGAQPIVAAPLDREPLRRAV